MSFLVEDDGGLPPAKAPKPTFSDMVRECNKELNEEVRKRLKKKYEKVQSLAKEGYSTRVAISILQAEERVAYIMTIKPATKGDYALLYWYYCSWFVQGLKFDRRDDGKYCLVADNYKDIMKFSPETPSRAARKWREYGFFHASPETEAKREVRESVYRNTMPKVSVSLED